MDKISVPMAMIDLIPVILFFIATLFQMKVLYPRMTPGQYAMYSTGAIMLFIGGILKVIWKFLYALSVCDYQLLSEQFFPMQGFSFVLMAVALISTLSRKDKKDTLFEASPAVPLVTTHIPFLIMTFFGTTAWHIALLRVGFLTKKKSMIFFILSYIASMAQVVLASKFDDSPSMHWTAEFTNILAQSFLLTGSYLVMKHLKDKSEEKNA